MIKWSKEKALQLILLARLFTCSDTSFERLKVLILPAGYIINVCISPGTKESAEQSMEIELQLSNAEED